ncbi:uncharacterized protein LOC117640270, partial [Thrips palmi]|uniref:Uncharacterized protein LOC117640270 n=1 Tax=Thrips palmi TaxID=161013 RepID=A0A6P8Y8R9_THRPL
AAPIAAFAVCGSRKCGTSPDRCFLLFLLCLVILWYSNQHLKFLTLFPRYIPCESRILASVPDRFVGFNNTVEPDGALLVPNLVHFVRVGDGSELVAPEDAACISAALRTQPGCTVMVHTDRAELSGAPWHRLLRQEGRRIRVVRRPRSLHVFGMPFRDKDSLHRVTALRVLMKHGGMYVPRTVYLQDDATPYRRLECAEASAPTSDPGVIVAHRDARLLQAWLHLHHDADLDWAKRPPHEPHLCRAMDEVPELPATDDPSELVHPDDWYLFARAL